MRRPSPPTASDDAPLGPITRYAVIGVLYGMVFGTVWAVVSDQYEPIAGMLGGFIGGLLGGMFWGLVIKARGGPRRT